MHNLNPDQQKELSQNPNIEKITETQIVYTAKFKIWAIEEYLKGKSPNEIFDENGIPPSCFIAKYCNSCLKRWKKKYFEQGEESFTQETRGQGSPGRPKKLDPNKLTYEELLLVVEVQHDVIEKLKKRKALANKK